MRAELLQAHLAGPLIEAALTSFAETGDVHLP
jgi:hypothetical protein